jgi:hypothetical protein
MKKIIQSFREYLFGFGVALVVVLILAVLKFGCNKISPPSSSDTFVFLRDKKGVDTVYENDSIYYIHFGIDSVQIDPDRAAKDSSSDDVE